MARAPHILHLHSTFMPGGKEMRCVQLINRFGPNVRHSIVSAMPGAVAAKSAIDRKAKVDFPIDCPALSGPLSLARFRGLARYMKDFDLVLGYNWGALDGVMAHRIFGRSLGLPPLIHHEDGFNEDEAQRLKRRRNWYRMAALTTARGLVVPSVTLEKIARRTWAQPAHKVHRIPNGIDLARFRKAARHAHLDEVPRKPGEALVGTLAGLRTVKNLPLMVRALAGMKQPARLVVMGEGPQREAIEAAARGLGVADRVHLLGHRDPARHMAALDVFVLSSDSEQQPISVIEAMASNVPVVSTDVGDVRHMIAPENAEFLVPLGDSTALAEKLDKMVGDADLRTRIADANLRKAMDIFDEKAMFRAYGALYGGAMGMGNLAG